MIELSFLRMMYTPGEAVSFDVFSRRYGSLGFICILLSAIFIPNNKAHKVRLSNGNDYFDLLTCLRI